MDADGDGEISLDEFARYLAAWTAGAGHRSETSFARCASGPDSGMRTVK
jgi:hypothetical protein